MKIPPNLSALIPLRVLWRPLRPFARALRTTRRTVVAVPDLVDAILILPAVAQQLEVVAFHTATLSQLQEELVRIRSDTAALPPLETRLTQVHEVLCRVDVNTQAVQQLSDAALPLSRAAVRLGRFADRMPQRRTDPRVQRTRD